LKHVWFAAVCVASVLSEVSSEGAALVWSHSGGAAGAQALKAEYRTVDASEMFVTGARVLVRGQALGADSAARAGEVGEAGVLAELLARNATAYSSVRFDDSSLDGACDAANPAEAASAALSRPGRVVTHCTAGTLAEEALVVQELLEALERRREPFSLVYTTVPPPSSRGRQLLQSARVHAETVECDELCETQAAMVQTLAVSALLLTILLGGMTCLTAVDVPLRFQNPSNAERRD